MTDKYPPMRGSRRAVGRIAAWTAVATIAVLAIAGVALAAPSLGAAANSAPAANAGASAAPDKQPAAQKGRPDKGKRRGVRARLGKTLHAEAVVRGKDGKSLTVLTQRGAVTAVNATSITLKSADGFVSTYAVNAESKVVKDRKAVKIGDVKVGDVARVIAVKSGDTKNARGIALGDKGTHAKNND